jgi:hypothetical protein
MAGPFGGVSNAGLRQFESPHPPTQPHTHTHTFAPSVAAQVGLAHISELSDEKVKDINGLFRPKQAVRAKVSGVCRLTQVD